VLSRQIICLGATLDEDALAISPQDLYFVGLVSGAKKLLPFTELFDELTDDFFAPRSKHDLRRRICFKTNSAIAQNEDSIECIIENRFELVFGGFQCACGVSVLSSGQHEEANVEHDGNQESG
jgi:hypothetical protein